MSKYSHSGHRCGAEIGVIEADKKIQNHDLRDVFYGCEECGFDYKSDMHITCWEMDSASVSTIQEGIIDSELLKQMRRSERLNKETSKTAIEKALKILNR